jgi:hypothetical protein
MTGIWSGTDCGPAIQRARAAPLIGSDESAFGTAATLMLTRLRYVHYSQPGAVPR